MAASAAPQLLLADLHLPPHQSPDRARFRAFLQGPAREARAVYLLGDVFEYWLGDDVGQEVYAVECAALRELTAAGVDVGFMHGNRDFLVGRDFAAATGVRLLPDPLLTPIAGEPTLLSHGDRYCTADLAYQRWRRLARNAAAQAVFRALPRRLRERIAQRLRMVSTDTQRAKSSEIVDVSPPAIEGALHEAGCRRIIHGHTHRPAEHRLRHGGERIVLADWRPRRHEYLRADEDRWRRVRLD